MTRSDVSEHMLNSPPLKLTGIKQNNQLYLNHSELLGWLAEVELESTGHARETVSALRRFLKELTYEDAN